jgi:hypothetical protein
MIWSCMTAYGPRCMRQIKGIMDQHMYKSIHEDQLFKTIENYGLDAEKISFQHDNDPKHKARSVHEWLNGQPFEVLKWPPQPPRS